MLPFIRICVCGYTVLIVNCARSSMCLIRNSLLVPMLKLEVMSWGDACIDDH